MFSSISMLVYKVNMKSELDSARKLLEKLLKFRLNAAVENVQRKSKESVH